MILERSILPVLALVWLVPAVALAAPAAKLDVDLGGGTTLALVLVPRGTFTQGSTAGELGRSEDERAHRVTLGNDVYIGKFPVTRGQFARFVSATGYRTEAEKGTSGGSGWDGRALAQRREFTWKSPGFVQTDDHPVTLVTYDDALAFTGWLTRTTGRAFTLPTEAQWEHAYRAGSTSAYYSGPGDGDALALGWFKANAGNGTRPVGQKKPNALGLHDLGGNVNEWCRDWYAPYGGDAAIDPVATTPDPSDKARRVLRGGSWLRDAKNGRAAARYRNTPGSRNADNGFRVAADPSEAKMAPGTPPTPPAGAPTPTPPVPGAAVAVGGFIFGGICLGTLGFVALIVALIFRSVKRVADGATRRLSSRLARDGFWIDARGYAVGSIVRYRYRDQSGQIHEGQARLESVDRGQYVYTGYAPTAVLALQIVDAGGQPSRRRGRSWSQQSSQQRGYRATSTHTTDDAPFRGYPSAY